MPRGRLELAVTALRDHFTAQQSEAMHNLMVYLENPAVIGEHPQLQEEMRGQLLQLANAEDALGCLERHEKQLTGE